MAEETIIQQEKLSFEKCLKVITTSQDKLSIAPEVEDVSDQMYSFHSIDGTLKLCDGIEGNDGFDQYELIDFKYHPNKPQFLFFAEGCRLAPKRVDRLLSFYGTNELSKGLFQF